MGREKRDGTVRRVVRGGGVAEVVPDRDRENAFLLLVDGTQQSHVDLADPSALEFEYMRRIAAVLDLTAPPGAPLRVLHLGGGALSLPRYLAATRPGSTQRVVEIDGALVELIRETLPLPKDAKIRVRVGDAREVVTGSPDASYDVVIGDVFDEARTPAHLTSVEFAAQVVRLLRPDGRYILNIADSPPLRFGRNAVATVRSLLPEVCLIADATVLRGRRYGNLVIAAGRTPLPLPDLRRRMAGDWFPSRVEAGPELDRFADGGHVVTDADAEPSPPPPELLRPERPEL